MCLANPLLRILFVVAAIDVSCLASLLYLTRDVLCMLFGVPGITPTTAHIMQAMHGSDVAWHVYCSPNVLFCLLYHGSHITVM